MRQCELSWTVENDAGDEHPQSLLFPKVQSYRCTYVGSIPTEMIEIAYDRVIEIYDSEYLRKTIALLRASRSDLNDIHHYAIDFDDGPFYEFITKSFSWRP